MVFNRLSILGVGLLGGSIGLAVKSIAKSCQIVGYGHRDASIGKALAMGAIDRGFASARQAVQDAALVLVCTPVGTFQSIFQEIANSLSPGAIVTDVGSTKRSAVRLAEELLPGHVRFVGSHPMAGSEKRGVESARADLFNGATCVVTPTDRTDPQALGAVEEFWRELGMTITRCSPEEHDRLVGSISHLPHALAAALVRIQNPQAIALAGKGFLDTTRIAAGDPGLWRDILIDNADNVRAAIDVLQAELSNLKSLLDPTAHEQLRAWLESAASARKQLSSEP